MEKRRGKLEQRLARMVAEGTDMDTIVGTEDTSSVEPETFPGHMAPFIVNKEEGATVVKKHTEEPGKISF